MIVSDATALITLINIDEFDLLYHVAERIMITHEVYKEVTVMSEAKTVLESEMAEGRIAVCDYGNKVLFDQLRIVLDSGESASIVLALEKRVPLLIDEKKGRQVAGSMGVEIVGLIGIIRFLYLQKILSRERTEEIIGKLNRSDFRISKALMGKVLA
jgi:predicted nucleic acid-binding protein